MQFLGLHILDLSVIVLYIVVILWLGHRVGRGNKNTTDFYIAGRRLGRFYQFFLNFGCSTDANQAVGVSREIYRQGIGGMWIQFVVLFLTPFYWFTVLFYRRCRLITIGDFFSERFRSPALGGAFALFALTMAVIGGGTGFMVAGKTMMALTPKPESEYTAQEKEQVQAFREYRDLRSRLAGGLTAAEQGRYEELRERDKRRELRSFVSYIHPNLFYLVYAIIVAAYTVMGGFTAAAITDAIQGVLIIIFSVALIPIGLSRIGGFTGLHASVPDYMFELFGTADTSEYTWYSIGAMALANLVSIVAVAPMMATAGSATNEMSARIGMLGGMFFKRFIMLFWALAGLIAIALYAGSLSDPDLIWGHMTRDLLMPGAVGLMLVGVLAANMSTLDATSVSNSALFIRNLYQPLRRNRPEGHYINVGRLVIVAILLGSLAIAMVVDDVLVLFKYFISLPAVFGAAIWLGFTWRRLTRVAVFIQVAICFTLYALIPNIVGQVQGFRTDPALLLQTGRRLVTIRTGALAQDVAAGRATKVGQTIQREHHIEPAGIFFDRVTRSDPADPSSPLEGSGRFHVEIWILGRLGLDLQRWTKAELVAARFTFSALFPFLLLFVLSWLTRPVAKRELDQFFARQHTPVQPTPEAEEAALAASAADPGRWEGDKILPGSNWEILKPGWIDILGFCGSWVLVGLICWLLWLVANLGG